MLMFLSEATIRKWGDVSFLKKPVCSDGKLTKFGFGLYYAVVGAVLYTLIYGLSPYYSPLFFPIYMTLSDGEQRLWDTRPPDIVFSVIICYYAFKTIAFEKLFWRKDDEVPMVKRTSYETYTGLGLMLGFFGAETVPTVYYLMGGGQMLLHHFGSLSSVGMAVFTGDAHCFTLWMLSMELTTIFISIRYILEKAGYIEHISYIINGMVMIFTWAFVRILTFIPFFLTLYRVGDELHLMNPFSQILVVIFPVVLVYLNITWYFRILRTAIQVLFP